MPVERGIAIPRAAPPARTRDTPPLPVCAHHSTGTNPATAHSDTSKPTAAEAATTATEAATAMEATPAAVATAAAVPAAATLGSFQRARACAERHEKNHQKGHRSLELGIHGRLQL